MKMLRAFWDGAVKIDSKAEQIDARHMPLCRSGQLSALRRQGVSENVHEQPQVITMNFESFVDYWDAFLLGQAPPVRMSRVSIAMRSCVAPEVMSRVFPSGEDLPLALSARVWSVCGTVPGRL